MALLNKEPMEVESYGYKKGRNPILGEYYKSFNFAPVPAGHRYRKEFVEAVHCALANLKYVYYGEVKVDIELYFNEQTRLETSLLADLDNYAKLICDSIKGANGLIIDDSQIQSLHISWVDTSGIENFTLSIKGQPDEFIPKPLSLFEMPDRLFYPLSSKQWKLGKIIKVTQKQKQLFLVILHRMISAKILFRHSLRQEGLTRLHAFWKSQSISPILNGFHKSRIVESGFDLHNLDKWQNSFDFKAVNQKITETLERMNSDQP